VTSHSTKPPYSVEPITTEQGLLSLEEDWKRLSGKNDFPNVFMTFCWFQAWNRHFAQEDHAGQRKLNVLVLKKNGAVQGIVPLIHRTVSRFGWVTRKVEFLGGHADYNDFVWGDDPEGQAETVVDFLVHTQDQWDLVDFRDLRETGNSMTAIERALSQAGLSYRVLPEPGRCPYLRIDAESSTIMKKLSGHVRRTLRKRAERARALGLRIRIIENPCEEPGLLDKLIVVERQKHLHGKLSQPFVGKYRQVFQALFEGLGAQGWFYIALMEFVDRPVAWQLGFRCGNRLWDYNKAYDHEFSRLAPGTLLVPAVLDYGHTHGYEEYDFLRGEEPYKMIWSTGYHERFRLVIRARRWTSRAHAFVYLDLKNAVYRLWGGGE
jgi:CelD/BcsL family acetyltransferase involved in cellulose biosynthesis